VRNVAGRLRDVYFTGDDKSFALNDTIKNRVKFEFGNLTQTPMPTTGPQDIVFCKNVTIYFSADVTRKLIQGLHDTLAPDGFLLLGHAESLWQMSNGFALVEGEGAFCYRKSSHMARSAAPAALERKRPSKRSAVALAFRSGVPAVRTKRKAAAKQDPRASDDYDLCLAAFRAGDWDSAEAGLSTLVASCPTFVPAQLLLGGLYAHRGRFEDAMRQAESVLKLSDLEPRAHLLLGMVEARRDRTDEALQSLRRALYLDDSLALAHFWLGNLYRDRGDIARACHEYENVVRDWERRTLQLTEEFASDLTAEQLVSFCSDSLERLRAANVAQRTNGARRN
jgi:chemotaxis protein methyltransferase CheR